MPLLQGLGLRAPRTLSRSRRGRRLPPALPAGRRCGKLRLGVGLLLALLLTFAHADAARAAGGVHVRVVLDTSKSMRNNDPGKLAILATMLLYDLVDPNPQNPQAPRSFVVLPFFPNWPSGQQFDGTMPTEIGEPIRATGQDEAQRDDFKQRLMALGYDANYTYFYPGLRAALDRLLVEAADPADRRIVVLVTDGLPEPWVRQREAELLLQLRREYNEADTRLYVLGFGSVVNANWDFFAAPFEGQEGERLGEAFPDPTGRRLVSTMGTLFSRGFGYLIEGVDGDLRAQPTLDVDLDNGMTPPEVKILAYRKDGGPAPSQSINPAVNNARGVMSARVAGAAYSVQSVTGVLPGREYRLTTDAGGAEVMIMRKVDPELRLLPHAVEHDDGRQPVDQLDDVVAETWFIPHVLARSRAGTDGNQAHLDIQVRTRGSRVGNDPCAFDGAGDYGGPVMGSRQPYQGGEGVTYEIKLRFPENPEDPAKKYPGYIEVIAKIEGNTEEVGEPLTCARAHGVTVWPKIAIRTDPREAWLNPTTLSEGEQGCVEFALKMDDPSRLAILDGPPIRLSAYLEPSEPGLEDGALAEAGFRLDGEPIGWRTDGSTDWYAGRNLTQNALLGAHRLCVTVGDPNIDAPRDGLRLTVRMQLKHPPYDDFPAVAPFKAKLNVRPIPPPSFDDFPWDSLWWLLAALLAALLGLRQLAPRLPLADDLGYELRLAADAAALADEAAAGAADRAPQLEPLPPLPWWARLLGLSPARALHEPIADRVVAWLKPVDAELFALRAARDMRVAQLDGSELAADRGLVQVEVQHDYLLLGEAGRWRLRLGYRRDTTAAPVAVEPAAGPAAGH
jgi:hypothetical protein